MNARLSPGTLAAALTAALGIIFMGHPVTVHADDAGGCPDKMAVIRMFYDSNDASQFQASLAYLDTGIVFTSWAEGVNGRHWHEQKLVGRQKIVPLLGNRGLRRISGDGSGPVYRESDLVVAQDRVTFMLRPDRRSPDGRPYNPYRIEAELKGCTIVRLTVVELISWE
ncbi:MAG: hypothetical protein ABSG21_04280 [Spirochaetia bacterium]|jgi:hypothetical protein